MSNTSPTHSAVTLQPLGVKREKYLRKLHTDTVLLLNICCHLIQIHWVFKKGCNFFILHFFALIKREIHCSPNIIISRYYLLVYYSINILWTECHFENDQTIPFTKPNSHIFVHLILLVTVNQCFLSVKCSKPMYLSSMQTMHKIIGAEREDNLLIV